ncbi:MAG: hypothetical protein K2X39_09860, partial [Silvanigrellaceae bacterium]|nr:hypothetical protein [Silvanigrellaceae bacterium]
MDDANIINDPEFSEKFINEEIYNFSQAEIAFETNKTQREQEIKNELIQLREKYINQKNLKNMYRKPFEDTPTKEIKEIEFKYAKLLARYIRTVHQPNLIFSEFPPSLQEKIKQRRMALNEFHIKNPEISEKINNFSMSSSYLSIHASRAYVLNNQLYKLENALITPCKCKLRNEPAAWAFSTKKASIEVGDYITMQGSTLDILEVPIFYSPILKLPIKNKRESGFLLPSGYTSNSGQAISVPYFLTLGDSADTTVTLNYFSKRGMRFDSDLRIKFMEDSQLNVVGEWSQDKLYRNTWRKNYALIEETISENKEKYSLQEQQQLRNYVGKDLQNRWYINEEINVPVSAWSAIKTNNEFVSDNRYFFDFSPIQNNSIDLFTIQSSNKRFINQNASIEYYGNDIVFSARVQQSRDLFAFDRKATPKRLPILEFYLLPKRYFSLPFTLDNVTSWEHIDSSKIYASVAQNQLQGFTQSSFASQENKISRKNERNEFLYDVKKSITPGEDPYLRGNRLHTSSSVTLPLTQNKYINAFLKSTGTFIKYHFPKVNSEVGEYSPSQYFAKHEAYIDFPIYGKMDYFDSSNNN